MVSVVEPRWRQRVPLNKPSLTSRSAYWGALQQPKVWTGAGRDAHFSIRKHTVRVRKNWFQPLSFLKAGYRHRVRKAVSEHTGRKNHAPHRCRSRKRAMSEVEGYIVWSLPRGFCRESFRVWPSTITVGDFTGCSDSTMLASIPRSSTNSLTKSRAWVWRGSLLEYIRPISILTFPQSCSFIIYCTSKSGQEKTLLIYTYFRPIGVILLSQIDEKWQFFHSKCGLKLSFICKAIAWR